MGRWFKSIGAICLVAGLVLLCGCGSDSDSPTQISSVSAPSSGKAATEREASSTRKTAEQGPESESVEVDPDSEGDIPAHGPNWDQEEPYKPGSSQAIAAGSRASIEAREYYEEAKPNGHKGHPGADTIEGRESVSNVTATGSLRRGRAGEPEWVLTVKYRVEYVSGLEPVGVRFDVRRTQYELGGGGSQALDHPEGVSTGTTKIPLATGGRPLLVKVLPYSKTTASVGEGTAILVR
jgi:hypothetical protein